MKPTGMNAPTVLFGARLMPPIIGGLERLSADVLAGLKLSHQVIDLAHYGSRVTQLPYLATLGMRMTKAARQLDSVVADGSDATLSFAVASADCPSVIRVVGLDIVYPNPYYQAYLRRYLPRVNTIVAISEPTRSLLRQFNISRDRTRVVRPGAILPANWRYSPVPGRILLVGRLVPRKGILQFVEQVWPQVAKENPEATVAFVGDGPERSRILKAINRAPSRGRIHFHGALSRRDLDELFSTADVVAMMNLRRGGDFEGFGIVAAEAALRGIPVVAYAVDGLADSVLHNETGLLLPSGRYLEAAEALTRIIGRSTLSDRRRIQEIARKVFGQDRLAREYSSVVQWTWETYG